MAPVPTAEKNAPKNRRFFQRRKWPRPFLLVFIYTSLITLAQGGKTFVCHSRYLLGHRRCAAQQRVGPYRTHFSARALSARSEGIPRPSRDGRLVVRTWNDDSRRIPGSHGVLSHTSVHAGSLPGIHVLAVATVPRSAGVRAGAD